MYFIVKKYLKIGDRNYRPCICYNLTDYLALTVQGLVKQGVAEISEEPFYFQNGKRLVKDEKKPKNGNLTPEFAENLQKSRVKKSKNAKSPVNEEPKEEPAVVDEAVQEQAEVANSGF